MSRFVAECAAEGIEAMAFGDLFLEDIRSYRESSERHGDGTLFPLWAIHAATGRRDAFPWTEGLRQQCRSPETAGRHCGQNVVDGASR